MTAVLFIVVHILDTQPYSFFYYLKSIPQQKSIVEEYYSRVASQNKKDAMILQLPFLTYAENSTESGIWNANEQVYGYIFTEDIKWSYGSFLGTEEDTRQGALYRTSDFSKIFFNAISEGYSGISVNSDLYKAGPEIINMIFDQTGLKPAFSDKNKELFYYSLKGVDKEALNYKSESDNLIINGFEGKGWTNMEPSGRWAGGGMVSELVYPFVPDGNYRIHIEADSLIKQDVDIYLNDRYIDHFHAEQGNIIFDTERILDHDSMVPKGTNALRLVHSNYFIPSKLNPKSSDGRMLTLMYKSISIIRDK